ncbi:MAG: CoA-binding protein [Thermoplasmata archaeon]|jgi:predicted CoA-binding protein|nr:CoA-binding protein [Thermoplasmata archaeon]
MMSIEDILLNTKKIAVIGASKDRTKPSRSVMRYLMRHGYICYPVNPTADYIGGIKAYKSILDIPDEIDVADVFLPSEKVMDVIDDIVKKGVKVLWLQEGIINEKAAEIARAHGIEVVMDKCMMKEHVKLRKEGKIESRPVLQNIPDDF